MNFVGNPFVKDLNRLSIKCCYMAVSVRDFNAGENIAMLSTKEISPNTSFNKPLLSSLISTL